MDYTTVCKVCQHQMKHVPIRKLEPYMVVEHYCPHCDASEIKYEKIET